MKKITITFLLASVALTSFAQDEKDETEYKERGFKKENLFTGGTLNLAFFNGATIIGASPQLGYSVNNWLDAGVVFGFNYTSAHVYDDFNYDIGTVRQTIIGPGAFVRIFPINLLFLSAQYEHNFMRQKAIPRGGGDSRITKVDENSFLIGAGYCSGRDGRNSPYYYLSVSVDILNRPNSPYSNGNNLLPVIAAGFNIPLFQGSSRRRY